MSDLVYEVTDDVGVINLNRPDAMNSLNYCLPAMSPTRIKPKRLDWWVVRFPMKHCFQLRWKSRTKSPATHPWQCRHSKLACVVRRNRIGRTLVDGRLSRSPDCGEQTIRKRVWQHF